MKPPEVGHAYELILTTRGGLCRYRLGDVVSVVGMMGQMPMVELQGRAGKSFNLCHSPACRVAPCGTPYPPVDFCKMEVMTATWTKQLRSQGGDCSGVQVLMLDMVCLDIMPGQFWQQTTFYIMSLK